jgi:signal transduction histidine kinase
MHWTSSVQPARRPGDGPETRPDGDPGPVRPGAGEPPRSSRPAAPPTAASRSQLPTHALLAAAVVVLCGVEAGLLLSQPAAPWVLALFPLAAAVWLAAGAVALLRRPANRLGMLMVAGALAWLVAGLANAPIPALSAAGLIVAMVPLAIAAHLLHAFPSGQLRGTASRMIVAGLYVATIALHVPAIVFLPDGAGAPLQLADRPDLARLGIDVQDLVGGGLMLATGLLLALRLRAASQQQRRVLAPLALYGIAAVVLVPLLSRLRGPLLGDDPVALFALQATLLGLLPLAFAGAMLRGGFAPTAGVQELSIRLCAGDGAPATLREALADALGDPSVELVLWAGERERWVDRDGHAATLPDPRAGRGLVQVVAAGRRVGAIVYDADLIADAGPVRDAAGVIALALDRDRLTAELLAGRERLRRSRARIAAAADQERRRIARDLHDGVQGTLVLLAMRAGELARDAPDPSARAGAAALCGELEAALGELRELVHGVLPAALVERGLAAAADDLADRMPLPTTVDAVPDRFPPAVESACWFVIAESLANAVRHAGATALAVRVDALAGGGVRVEVRDDGAGGAAPGAVSAGGDGVPSAEGFPPAGGTGLRGLADRVDVLGGRLLIDSPPGGGTAIVAEVPCGS